MENSHFGIRTWPDAFVKKCAPFLRAAEVLLVGAKCGHPADFLIFRNP
jgi:hypothetical protein